VLRRAATVFTAAAARHGALFILNDDPQLAVEVDADGVHVGQEDMRPEAARAVVGGDRIVGWSTHNEVEVDAAVAADCDYFAIGPVHATPTKQGRPPIGLDPVRHAAAVAGDRPWFVTGDMGPATAGDVLAAGGRRLVVVRALTQAADPARATAELVALLRRSSPGRVSVASASFDQLQRGLIERLQATTPEDEATTIIVCPSLSFPVPELRKITGIRFYEERLLCFTLLLRNPELQIIFPTSVPVDPAIVDYYLSWLPDPAHARARLHLVPVGDPTPSSLTDKLLARPDIVDAIRRRVDNPGHALLLPFNVTRSEGLLAEQLGVPIYGSRPDLVDLGSKSGAREVAREAGVAVFEGAGDLWSLAELEREIRRIFEVRAQATAVVAKLNHGFSGQGNVIIERGQVRSPLSDTPAVFCADEESWETYAPKVAAEGAIVEELARGRGIVSPSVQLRILPGGRCETISTHDQVLGGPDDQVYLGCRFPARSDYRGVIAELGLRVARVLARRGVLGSFGIDFVVTGDGVFLSEINLRLGGTTHPLLMAREITGGTYDTDSGELLVRGEPRVYQASDNLKSLAYVGLRPADAIAAVAAAGLAYDPATATGVTLHLLGALTEHGKCGALCIARSHEEADELSERLTATLDARA
jgi:thiamine-phosphate diphosphorylase